MFTPHQDRSWMLFFPVICMIVWMWAISGCSSVSAGVLAPTIPGPPDIFANGPVVFGSASNCPLGKPDVLIGYPDRFTVAYGYKRGTGSPVVFMITILESPKGGYIEEAWVDIDGDGIYDLYFDNGDDLREAYPKPCSAIGVPT